MNKPSNWPLVTFGLPTVNSEKRLSVLLDSLQAQTYGDFKILISDNASTDGTNDLCQEYAAKDSRITVFRQPERICMRDNFKFLLDKADTKYFSWQSDDDYLSERWLESTFELLNTNPQFSMAFTNIVIERDGVLDTSQRKYDLADTIEGRIEQLFTDYRYKTWLGMGLNGLWRVDHLQNAFNRLIEVHRDESLIGTDVLLMFNLMISQNFGFVREPLFKKRYLFDQRTYLINFTYGQRYKQYKRAIAQGSQYMAEVIKSLNYSESQEKKLIALSKSVVSKSFFSGGRLRLLKWRLLPWYKKDLRKN